MWISVRMFASYTRNGRSQIRPNSRMFTLTTLQIQRPYDAVSVKLGVLCGRVHSEECLRSANYKSNHEAGGVAFPAHTTLSQLQAARFCSNRGSLAESASSRR